MAKILLTAYADASKLDDMGEPLKRELNQMHKKVKGIVEKNEKEIYSHLGKKQQKQLIELLKLKEKRTKKKKIMTNPAIALSMDPQLESI